LLAIIDRRYGGRTSIKKMNTCVNGLIILMQLMPLQQIVNHRNLVAGWCSAIGEKAFRVQATVGTAGVQEILILIDSRRNSNNAYSLDFEGIEDTVSYGYRARQCQITSIVYL
jgi:hypothetical protein